MQFKSFLVLFVTLFFAWSLQAQQLVKKEAFSLGTPFLEPDGRRLTLKVNEQRFAMLVKTKGRDKGSGEYALEMRTEALDLEWSRQVEVGSEENFVEMMANEQTLILFSVEHDLRKENSVLYAAAHDLKTGERLWRKSLLRQKIGSWYETYNKGMTVRQLQEYIASGSRRDFVTPLEYRFEFSFSADRQKMLVYYYDYSKPNLTTNLYLFDAQAEMLERAQIPIDKGYRSYGLYINNAGQVFILNADFRGNITVNRYDLKSKTNVFLKLQAGNIKRTDVKLRFSEDQIPYVVCLTESQGKLNGLLLSRFDFNTSEVSRSVFHPLSRGFRNQVDSAMLRQFSERAQWKNFDVTDFHISAEGRKTVLLESRNYIFSGVSYEPGKSTDPEFWKERRATVEVGEVLIFAFNEQDSLSWHNFIIKDQQAVAAEGLNTISYSASFRQDELRLIYAYAEEGSRSVNQLQLLRFGLAGGKLLQSEKLPLDEKFSYIRPYTYWTSQGQLILAGRKLWSGRSSELFKFDIQSQTASKAVPAE